MKRMTRIKMKIKKKIRSRRIKGNAEEEAKNQRPIIVEVRYRIKKSLKAKGIIKKNRALLKRKPPIGELGNRRKRFLKVMRAIKKSRTLLRSFSKSWRT